MKKFKYLLVLSLLTITAYGQSNPIKLSDQAEILVLTCGPDDDELYAAFGHNAFRVYDPINKIDWVYNYGTFDFEQPNFYLNFARGFLLYQLARQDYQRFKNAYIYFNRSIYEQVLNLNQSQKQRLFNFLEINNLPENREYYYDYFYDNCATKLRDVLVEVFGDSIRFDPDYVNTEYTFRELVDIYTENQRWGDLGIDLCLGLPMDKTLSPDEYMFLPDYIFKAFANATLLTDGGTKPLVKRSFITYQSVPRNGKNNFYTNPGFIFWTFFFIASIITFIELRKNKHFKIIDISLFAIAGFLGVFMLFLWFGTNHKSEFNFNLLWAIPLHFPIGFLLIKKELPSFIKPYFMITGTILVLTLAFWAFLPQQLNPALIPLVIVLTIRAFRIYFAR